MCAGVEQKRNRQMGETIMKCHRQVPGECFDVALIGVAIQAQRSQKAYYWDELVEVERIP